MSKKVINDEIEKMIEEEYRNANSSDITCGCEMISFEDFRAYRLSELKLK